MWFPQCFVSCLIFKRMTPLEGADNRLNELCFEQFSHANSIVGVWYQHYYCPNQESNLSISEKKTLVVMTAFSLFCRSCFFFLFQMAQTHFCKADKVYQLVAKI